MCARGCYDVRHVCCYKESQAQRANNSAILKQDPVRYFREVDAASKFLRYLRFHVGGDIACPAYLTGMVDVAIKNPHCHFLAFTKMYDIVNKYLDDHGSFPDNLHIILSGWRGDTDVNRHHLPVSSPVWKDGSKSCMVTDKVFMCPGNCTECARADEGCWAAKSGDTILFEAH